MRPSYLLCLVIIKYCPQCLVYLGNVLLDTDELDFLYGLAALIEDETGGLRLPWQGGSAQEGGRPRRVSSTEVRGPPRGLRSLI